MRSWKSHGFLNVTKGSDPFVTLRGEVVFGEEQLRVVLSAEWKAWGCAGPKGGHQSDEGVRPL